jgi:hypoxanthine phosphoribosyltransferase
MAEAPAAGSVKPLFSAETIAARVEALAREIAAAKLHELIIVAVLKGSFIFAADLVRALHRQGLAPEIDFMFLASYGAGTEGGAVKVLRDIGSPVAERDVVIVDDILDSGRTLLFAKELLEKVPREVDITPDFSGFECPAVFVVGYGTDIANRYRELPFIGVPED